MKYFAVFEKTESGFSAFSPDLPGCVATGNTLEQTKKLMQEAMAYHLDGLLGLGEKQPMATTQGDFLEVAI